MKDKTKKKKHTKRNILIAILIFLAFATATPIAFLHFTDIAGQYYYITVEDEGYTYTGKAIEPKVTMKNKFLDMEEGKDFTVTYKDNVQVGTAQIIIDGAGFYRGEVVKKFDIGQAKQRIKGDDSFRRNVEGKDFPLDQSAKTKLTYKSSDQTIAKVDDDGNVDPISPGTVTITVTAEESDTYKKATKKITVEVTETTRQQMLRKTLEWGTKIADNNDYQYGHGKCPICHKGAKKEYDCISFIVAAYWHGGGLKSMEYFCERHHYVKAIRKYMRESGNWKNCGKLSIYDLEPGDVVYFYNKKRSKKNDGWYHCAIYYGDGNIIGAHSKSAGISYFPMSSYFFDYKEAYRYIGD